jgi:hypothetical protein
MKSIVIGLLLFTLVFVVDLLSKLQREWPFLFNPYSSVVARVVAVDPKSHGRVDYSYSITNREYQGIGFGFEQQVGTPLTIYYLQGKPWRSRIDKPTDGIASVIGNSALGALFIALGGTLLMKMTGQLKGRVLSRKPKSNIDAEQIAAPNGP